MLTGGRALPRPSASTARESRLLSRLWLMRCSLRRDARGLGKPTHGGAWPDSGRAPSLLAAVQTVRVMVITDALGGTLRRLVPSSRWGPGGRVKPSCGRLMMRQEIGKRSAWVLKDLGSADRAHDSL
jgi:hypothetical protein